MKSIIKTLEQLRQMRARGVSELTGKLAQQKQLCQRYERNIETLTTLSEGGLEQNIPSAIQMSNHSSYKRSIQKVIDWQKQEHALANKTAESLQQNLVKEACREKTVDLVLSERKNKMQLEESRKDQRTTDSMSLQSWMRQRKSYT